MAAEGGKDVLGPLPLGNGDKIDDGEASLDLAEELFVSCRFTAAIRVCNNALTRYSCFDRTRPPASSAAHVASASETLVAFEDLLIAPVGACDTSDLLVAVLLQCGFELGRSEEWARCRSFYEVRGAMPFAIAVLWLRLRLAGGEMDLVRGVLWSLQAELNKEQQRFSVAREDRSEGKRDLQTYPHFDAARANYAEVMDTLIMQVMLPGGESTDALSLVTSDPHLGPKQKSRLAEACAAWAASRTSKPEPRDESGPIRDRHSGGSNNGRVGGDSRVQGYLTTHDREGPPEQQGMGEGSLAGSFFSGFSELTPEARLRLVVAAGVAGLVAYATCRRRESLWRAVRNAAGLAKRTAGDLGTFIVGSS